MIFWNCVVSRGKENWQRDKLCHNRPELVPDWWWERWCGEKTQAVVVESLQRSPQAIVCPSCLLLDIGLEWIGVAVPGVRFSVNLDERRREWMNHISHQLVLERNARILSFFSCTTVFLFSFYQFFFWNRSLQSHLWLWGTLEGCVKDLNGVYHV